MEQNNEYQLLSAVQDTLRQADLLYEAGTKIYDTMREALGKEIGELERQISKKAPRQ